MVAVTKKSNCNSLAVVQSKIKNIDEAPPGSELFPRKGPYVPSGLSAEEYQRLKKAEADKLKSMNFGAWGPRFKPSEAPDGDWMIMRSLWTNGFKVQGEERLSNYNTPWVDQDMIELSPVVNSLSQVEMFLRRNILGFVLSFILLDSLATAMFIWKAGGDMTVRHAMKIILKREFLSRRMFYMAAFLKSHAVQLAMASFLTPWMNKYLEEMNRKRLWSRRRTSLAIIGASFITLFGWAGTLCLASGMR